MTNVRCFTARHPGTGKVTGREPLAAVRTAAWTTTYRPGSPMTLPVYCRICGTAGAACGDSHMTAPPISMNSFKGETMPEVQKTEEYHYWVGHIEHTAMLTPKMAERLGAKPIDEELEPLGTGNVQNNEAQRASTAMRDADDSGVTNPDHEDAAAKTRQARNKRATGV